MALMLFGVALGAAGERLRRLFDHPRILFRSFLAMFVVMPVVAVLVARYLQLNHALLVALLLLALSPVPPVLPTKQIKAGGSRMFVVGLLVLSALAAIAVVPSGIAAIGYVFKRELEVPFEIVARVVAASVLLPVVVGLVVGRAWPGFAKRAVGPVAKISGIVLLVSFLPIPWVAWDVMTAEMNNFTVLAMIAFIAIGLVTGHLLGGPDPGNRTTLALATATRHPGVAIAVLHAINPQDRQVVRVVLLYLLVGTLVSLPYVRWRMRAQSAAVR